MREYGTIVVSGADNSAVTGPFVSGGILELARYNTGWYWTAYGVTSAGEWFDLEAFGPYRSRKTALRRANKYLFE